MSLFTTSMMNSNSAAAQTVAQSLATSRAATTTTTSAAATAAETGGISSSDFLTLLVTEMKNQDPTQPTDPNAYVQQLVGVNSLQQLISINQDLTPASTSGAATSSNAASGVSSVMGS